MIRSCGWLVAWSLVACGSPPALAAHCRLPRVVDAHAGFEIGRPSGAGSILITATSAGNGLSLRSEDPGDDALTSSFEYRDAVNSRLSQEWEETIGEFNEVESPTTGERFEAPFNAYDPTGPDGPGYYRPLPGGGEEKLDPVGG